MNKKKKKDKFFKIYGTFEDVIKVAMSGNPQPKRKKKVKKGK